MTHALEIIAKRIKQRYPHVDVKAFADRVEVYDMIGGEWIIKDNVTLAACLKELAFHSGLLEEIENTVVPAKKHTTTRKATGKTNTQVEPPKGADHGG